MSESLDADNSATNNPLDDPLAATVVGADGPAPPSPYFEQSPAEVVATSGVAAEIMATEAAVAEVARGQSQSPLGSETEVTRQRHNVRVLVLYDVALRIGWIFKTESVIMPAFLDAVAGAGWLRGLLPVVNRFGQSIPPALFAPRLRRMPLKRRALAFWTLGMASVFLMLSGVWCWLGQPPPWWMAAWFLLMYAAFSICHGVNQLSYGTVQGKLITVANRGRLMALSASIGSWLALSVALLLMGKWLARPGGGFEYIFGFTGILFAVAAVIALLVREPADPPTEAHAVHDRAFAGAWEVLRSDPNFRRFALVAMLSGSAVILFPHYQAMGRERLGLASGNLMVWVVVQNAAVGLFGLWCGWIVHRRGERLALRVALYSTSLAPLVATILARLGPGVGSRWFWIVFIPLGMTPISLKTMLGYAIEASSPHDHPRYLSTLSMCLAAPFVLSPLVGWLVDRVGFESVFLCGALVLLVAATLTFRLEEPRHRHTGHTP